MDWRTVLRERRKAVAPRASEGREGLAGAGARPRDTRRLSVHRPSTASAPATASSCTPTQTRTQKGTLGGGGFKQRALLQHYSTENCCRTEHCCSTTGQSCLHTSEHIQRNRCLGRTHAAAG